MAENIPIRGRRDPDPPAGSEEAPPAPAHLTPESAAMWDAIVSGWVLDAAALPLLQAALESWDLHQRARAILADEGLVVVTGKGMRRAHPAAAVSKDALSSFRQFFRQLGLDPATDPTGGAYVA